VIFKRFLVAYISQTLQNLSEYYLHFIVLS
jgi:hypothetical protein